MTAIPKAKAEQIEVPVVDQDRIQRTYAELKKMEVRLDANPIDHGPKRFNNRIAKVRAMLTRLEQIFLQTSEDRHYFQRIISKKNALYELDRRELMTTDPKVRVGRSQGEREDLANQRLRDRIEELQGLQLCVEDLEALMVVIKSKRTDLKDIQGRMRDQMKLIEHDIGMGARWGKQPAPKAEPVAVADTEEIDNLLAATDETPLGLVPDEEDEEVAEEATEEEETVEVVEDEGDPAPHVEPEPVLVFGDEEEAEESESDDPSVEDLIPTESAEGSFSEEEETENKDADNFLDALGSLDDEEDSSKEETEKEGQGVDELLAMFSED